MNHDRNARLGAASVELWRRNAELLQAAHAYDPAQEHDSCGVGLIAATGCSARADRGTRGSRAAAVDPRPYVHRGPGVFEQPCRRC